MFALHDLPGGQPIADTSSVQKHPLGTRVRAVDPVYGEDEFIYLKGVVGTVVGSVVIFDQKNGTTTLSVAATQGSAAVAMSANVASQYGWYAVAGAVSVQAAGGTVAGLAYATATAGVLANTVVVGQRVGGLIFVGAVAGGIADAQLNHPTLKADA